MWGEEEYESLFACRGVKVCFVRSLKASSNGWIIPIIETLFGPNRLWNKPITLRSKRVKNATDKRISRQWMSQLRKIIKTKYIYKWRMNVVLS